MPIEWKSQKATNANNKDKLDKQIETTEEQQDGTRGEQTGAIILLTLLLHGICEIFEDQFQMQLLLLLHMSITDVLLFYICNKSSLPKIKILVILR